VAVVDLRHGSALSTCWRLHLRHNRRRVAQEHRPQRSQEAERYAQKDDAPYRGNGVGSLILNKLVDQAKHKSLDEVYLNAQVRAMAFYALHGFEPEGDEFLEANIPHVRMRRRLEK
jgi:predicted GNAT family N-acyltransferase